jgi:Na+-transporting methylmalonyl-CoA/oxaloacetate decarboxylase gamma subunit
MENISLSLWITLIGMGLVFMAIIVLWIMMTALSKLTEEKESIPPVDDRKRKIAAIAVAYALEQQKNLHISEFPLPPTAIVSAWQLTRRTENLRKEGKVR